MLHARVSLTISEILAFHKLLPQWTTPSLTLTHGVLELTWEPVCANLFAGVSPGTASQPSAVLESVEQDHTDSLGNTNTNTVQVYFIEILHACRAMRGTFEYDAVTHFINNLTPGIKAEVEVNWTRHHDNLSRDRHVQMILLAEAQVEAAKAETKIGNRQGIIQ